MTPTQRTLLWAYAALIAIWPIRHVALTLIFRTLNFLTPASPKFADASPPLVSAIIPAKDEQEALPICLASVCAQRYPNLEILVVDDRSTDGTAAIARAFADADPRVRMISIADLPAGWTGKTHALHVAAGEARGEWLWFLDADTRQAPDCLSIVLEHARVQGAAMVSLLPEMRCETFWEEVVQPLASIVLLQSFPLFLVHRANSPRAFANGQFILIGREALAASGGHAAVRDRFVEDIYLARNVKAAGLAIRVAMGKAISSTRMYTSLPQIVRGWARILYDALARRPLPLLGKALDPLAFSQSAHLALIASLVMLALGTPAGPFPAWLLAMSLVHHVLAATVLYRLYRQTISRPGRAILWYPLAGLVIDVILYRAIQSCLTGRVTWRGTDYGTPPPSTVP